MQIFTPFAVKGKGRLLRVIALILPVVCLVVLLAQTALAQNTFVITDGDQVTVHTSFASDPEKILDEAGQVGIMIGADCTVPTDIDDNRLEWVRQACVKYAAK